MSLSVSLESVGGIVPGGATDPTPYRFVVLPFPPGHFKVLAFQAEERLSKPYKFDITVVTSMLVGEDLERLALGQRAVFIMTLDGVTRVVPGIVARITAEGVRSAYGVAQYRMRLVPALWRLKQRKRSRIFQDMAVPEVVEAVVGQAGIAMRWSLSQKHVKRAYCTQYEETDLEFVARLLAEAGISYFFAPPLTGLEGLLQSVLGAAPGPLGDAFSFAEAAVGLGLPAETVVFTDEAAAYAPLPSGGVVGAIEALAQTAGAPAVASLGPVSFSVPAPTLHFLAEHGFAVGRSDKVTALVVERRVRPNVAEYRDFDPARPSAPLVFRDGERRRERGAAAVAMRAAEGALDGTSGALDIDLDGGPSVTATLGASALGALGGLLERHDLEIYEHHGRHLFPDWQDGMDEPGRMCRARRRRASFATGASLCAMFSPGHRFNLAGHPVAAFERGWTLIAVRHSGKVAQAAELYENSFEVVPDDVHFPPKRRPRATVQAMVTATVVGPAGEEIYTDAACRIKVHFHWDREGPSDEHASCWLRTLQAWAGAGWGTQYIPRVGMEVAVVFDGGDPDRPLVTGCVYNGSHPPTFPLPEDRTRSGIRTRSSPHAQGFNELSFEDAAGREQIYLHAQHDFDERVLHEHTLDVGSNERIKVGGMRQEEIGEDLYELVRGEKDVKVKGNHATVVEGALLETIDQNADYLVHGTRHIRIDGQERREVGGAAEQRFEQDLLTRVEGNHTVVVGRNEAKRSYTLRVEGTTTLSAEDGLVFECPKGITFSCGETSLRIGPQGVETRAKSVRSTGKDAGIEVNDGLVTIRTPGAVVQCTEDGVVATTKDSASFSLKKEAKLQGSKILLNSPDKATDQPTPGPLETTKIELTDLQGNPLGSQRFVVTLEDGSDRAGVTDKDGKATLDLPGDGEIRFAELCDIHPKRAATAAGASMDDWAPYVVSQGDDLHKIAFRSGVGAHSVWNSPKNKTLKELRGNGDILAPGDVLYLPKKSTPGSKVTAAATNKYRASIPVSDVNIVIAVDGAPVTDEPFELHGLPLAEGRKPPAGTTDADGRAAFKVPVGTRVVDVCLPKRRRVLRMRIGEMDPATEQSGLAKRLANLGFLDAHAAPTSAAIAGALRSYQRRRCLEETGIADRATLAAMAREGH